MGLESMTSAVTGRRSNQLSHRAVLRYSLTNSYRFHQKIKVKPSTY